MVSRDETLMAECGRRIAFDRDLPEMIFPVTESAGFFFFERPVFSYAEIVGCLLDKNKEIYGSPAFLMFGRPADNWCRQFVETDSEDFAGLVSSVYSDFGGGELGYPVVMANKKFEWILYESSNEDIAVLQVGLSDKAAAFISAISELDPIGCRDMSQQSPRYPLLKESFGSLLDKLSQNYCGGVRV
jgi:hypothetical protein